MVHPNFERYWDEKDLPLHNRLVCAKHWPNARSNWRVDKLKTIWSMVRTGDWPCPSEDDRGMSVRWILCKDWSFCLVQWKPASTPTVRSMRLSLIPKRLETIRGLRWRRRFFATHLQDKKTIRSLDQVVGMVRWRPVKILGLRSSCLWLMSTINWFSSNSQLCCRVSPLIHRLPDHASGFLIWWS